MICPLCKEEGKKSEVFFEHSSTSCMGYSPHWDNKGNFHNHDPNPTKDHYHCSKGHHWQEEQERSCPNCDWTG